MNVPRRDGLAENWIDDGGDILSINPFTRFGLWSLR